MTLALKLLTAALGLALLLRFDVLDAAILVVAWSVRYELSAIAVLYLATFVLAGIRWHLLLRVTRFPIAFRDTGLITLIAFFFSGILPGAISADGVRGAYLLRYAALHPESSRPSRAAAVASILADRTVGLFGLVLFTTVAVATGFAAGSTSPMVQRALSVLTAALVSLTLAGAGAFVFGEYIRAAVERRGWLQSPRTRWIKSLLENLLVLRHHPRAVTAALCIALVNHGIGIAVLWAVLRTLSQQAPEVFGFVLASTLALVSNVLPITPGGIGVAEVTFEHASRLLQPGGLEIAYGTAFFVFRLLMIACSLIGGVAFLVYRLPPARSPGATSP